jgi:hypothetical protein
VRARVPGVFAKNAIAAVVAAKVGQGQKDFAGVRDGTWLESLFGGARFFKELREEIVGAPEELESSLARQGLSTAHLGKRLSQSAGLRSGFSGGAQDASGSEKQVDSPRKSPGSKMIHESRVAAIDARALAPAVDHAFL